MAKHLMRNLILKLLVIDYPILRIMENNLCELSFRDTCRISIRSIKRKNTKVSRLSSEVAWLLHSKTSGATTSKGYNLHCPRSATKHVFPACGKLVIPARESCQHYALIISSLIGKWTHSWCALHQLQAPGKWRWRIDQDHLFCTIDTVKSNNVWSRKLPLQIFSDILPY